MLLAAAMLPYLTIGFAKSAGGIDNLAVGLVFFDLRARTDDVDLTVANKHAAVANDREIGHLGANARSVQTC